MPANTTPIATPIGPVKMPREFYRPRWWPCWMLLGLARMLCLLPLPWLRALGSVLGRLFGHLVKSRRHIVDTNLRLCFPQLGAAARAQRVSAHFEALGMGLFETLYAWLAPDARIAPCLELLGREHLEAATAGGRGALLLTGHFTTLEIGARALCLGRIPFHAMYRPLNSRFFDAWMRRWRETRSQRPALPKDDLRALVRSLRQGGAIWYGPDQTLEAPNARFVPFFGVPALTLTATARLAQMGRARVVPFFPERIGGRYRVTIQPALDNFPSGDERADAARINRLLEQAILRCPEQYFWIHRKFKYRPPGEPDLYARRAA
jgi:KDO2-lipid IV(A) lauroyltransferase